MKSITIQQDDQGLITVSVDGGEPQQVQSAEEACSILEQALGQSDGDDQGVSKDQLEEAFAGGFTAVRGPNGLNGRA